ncbi:MAG TPA: hypothetical protein VFC78_22275 [Tepidisphaeraceae bacterium]|nr:hypothetical protein [Tepidisphaeraceae bacterium]
MDRLDSPADPSLVLEGTIEVVGMCVALLGLGRDKDIHHFLNLQTYDPASAADADYVFTFDIYGHAFARVLVDTKLHLIDLADLYGSPWHAYKSVGFRQFWVSHPDWTPLTAAEVTKLTEDIIRDFGSEYSEDDIEFSFDDFTDESYFRISVQDLEEFDET